MFWKIAVVMLVYGAVVMAFFAGIDRRRKKWDCTKD